MKNQGRQGLAVVCLGLAFLTRDAKAEPSRSQASSSQPSRTQVGPHRPAESQGEYALGALEFLSGTALGVATLVGAVTVMGWDSGGRELGTGLLLVAPALQGLAVCGIGRLSQHYDGGCVWPVAGAYLGALALFPLVFTDDSWGSPFTDPLALAAGAGLGIVLGAPVGATWAWNAARQPRAPARAEAVALPVHVGPPLAPARVVQLFAARF
jgi:hypothetical protein